jgi:hypothetical protein
LFKSNKTNKQNKTNKTLVAFEFCVVEPTTKQIKKTKNKRERDKKAHFSLFLQQTNK